MDEIKISEQRFMDLIEHEAKAEELYERIIISIVKNWKGLYKKSFDVGESKEEVAEYVNDQLRQMDFYLKDSSDGVWLRSQGSGEMMYWGFRDSKVIKEISKILEK